MKLMSAVRLFLIAVMLMSFGREAVAVNVAPTVATPAAASPNPVTTGTTTALSVLGADDGGAAALIYTWDVNMALAPAPVTFSANGTNAARSATATFTKAGWYLLRATIRDAGSLTVTSSVWVEVRQVATTLANLPASASVSQRSVTAFTADMRDQFGGTFLTQPAFTWTKSLTDGLLLSANSYVMDASGSDIWNTSDGFRFAHQSLTGDGTITAKIEKLGNTDAWAKAGVMMRDGLAANAVNAMTNVTAASGALFQRRVAVGGVTVNTIIAGQAAPKWVRLQRVGNTFTGSYSPDGTTWTVITSEVITMGPTVYVGLASTAHNTARLTRSVFSNVTVTTPSTTAVAPASPWIQQDITSPATVGLAGSSSYLPSTKTFTVTGSGRDIWDGEDGFRFVHQPLTGDATLIARVVTHQNTHTWAKAGVMIRDGLAANAREAMVNVTAAAGVLFQYRPSVGATTVHQDVTPAEAPIKATRWLKLTRKGDVFTGFHSADGQSWTRIWSTSVTMAATVNVGLAVSSHTTTTSSTATFDNVSIYQGADSLAVPLSPWRNVDIGTTVPAGATRAAVIPGVFFSDAMAPGSVTLTSSASGRTANSVVTVANTAPTVVVAANATPSPATGTTTALKVVGGDDLGEEGLIYTWATTGTPPAAVTFSANDTNAAKNVTATFTKAGTYAFQATIRDAGSLTATSNVTVTVNQTLTSVVVSPASVSLATDATQTFTATGRDQFATALTTQPTFTWTTSGGGTFTSPGIFKAGNVAGGPHTITATSGVRSGTASVTVTTSTNTAPTVATAAAASPNPVTGTTTALSVLGADTTGGEAALTYTWATTGTPPAAVTFSANGTNAAKNVTATFTKAGSYTLQATIRDAGTLTVTSSVAVTVNATLTTIVVSPATVSLATGVAQAFTASGRDQFATTLTTQPTFTWSGTGTPTIAGSSFTWATAGTYTVTAASGGKTGTATATVITNTAPTVATAAAASPSPVTGTTTALSVLGADTTGGETALTYTWATTGTPPAAVTFSANGTNAAKSSTATFTKAGSYTLQATIRDAGNLTVTSSVAVTVNATLTTVVVSPASATVMTAATQTFTATGRDQFATALVPQPTFTWTTSGGGTISTAGVFTAGATAGGPFTITAASGGKSGTAAVAVTSNTAPTVATAAAASPNPVTGTTAALSVLGADTTGGEAALTYTWATTGTPPAAVTFSANGTNAAKSSTATFTKAGSYTLQATIRDAGNLTVTSSVAVTVNATLTTIVVSPATVSVATGVAQVFTASGRDQFATTLTTQPTFTWSGTGTPTIVGSSFTWATAGTYTVTAASGGKTGTATVTVTAGGAPTIAITAPTSGSSVNAPGPVTFTVTAADSNGTVSRVDYFEGQNLIGSSTTSPFGITWSNVPAATYTITARATDNSALTTTSAPITLIVNAPPSVVLTGPVNGATFAPGATVPLVATAQDIDGTVAQVQFFNGATSLNIDTSSPFGYNWAAVPAGTYSLTAVAIDNRGKTTTSPAITVLVQGTAPTVAMAASASPNPVTGTTTTVTALGQDDGGEPALKYTWSASPATGVVFLPNGTHASQVSVVSFPNAGSYTLTCTIADAQSNTVTTAASVTVQHVATTIAVTPSAASVVLGQAQVFSASVVNQFGAAVSPQPTLTWSLPSPAGALSATTGASVTMFANNLVGGPHQMTVTGASLTQPVFVTVQPFASAGGGGSPDDAGVDSVQLHVGQKGPYSYDPGTHADGYPHNYIQLNWTRESIDGVGLAGFILPGDSPANCFYRPDLQYDATGPEGSCEVATAWVIGERPGKVKIRRVAIGNTNRDTSKSGNPVYDCNQSTGGPVRESNTPVTRETIVTVLPNGKPQKTPLGSKYARVDSHGVPMPDASPTGEGEQDRIPNSAYTDMYALAPTYSVTDVAQPVEGGELVMEFRRTVSIGRRGYFMDHKQRSIAYPTADLLGAGWDVNIGSRLVIGQSQDANGIYQQDAVVTDETGGTAQYSYNATTGLFSPDVEHSFNNASLKSSLKKVGSTYIYKKAHGTTLVFEQLPASGSVPADRNFMPPAIEASECSTTVPRIEHYYRVQSVTDRNGNRIRFTYKTLDAAFSKLLSNQPANGSGPDGDTLVDTMYEEAHPERKITFTYVNLGFEGPGLDPGWRVKTVTDSLNRVITYNYYPTAPWNTNLDPNSQPVGHANYANQRCLSSVVRPAVESGTPTVTFDYTRYQLADQTLDPLQQASTLSLVPEIRYIAPKTITDARGHTTGFSYVSEWFPSATYADFGGGVVWEQKIRVDGITTVDGTARFSTVQRTATQVTTKVTDTKGTTTTYGFTQMLIGDATNPVPSITGRAMAVTSQTRNTLMGDGTSKTATFTYSGDLCNNLTQVTDLSGNIIQYSYVNAHTDAAADTFNKGIYNAGIAVNPNSNPNGYQAYGKPCTRTVDPGTAPKLNLVTRYRHQTGLDVNGQSLYTKEVKTIDAEGIVTRYTLDATGNRLTMVEGETEAGVTPVTRTTTYVYNSTGFVTKVTDAELRVTEFAQAFTPANLNAYRTATTTVKGFVPAGPVLNYVSTVVFDAIGNRRSATDARGKQSTFGYDNLNRSTSETRPAVINAMGVSTASTAESHYDSNGNVIWTKDHEGNRTYTTYDAMNRATTVRRRMNDPLADHASDLISHTTYDKVGLTASSVDANGNTTSFTYDNLMRVVTKTHPAIIEPGTTTFVRYTEQFTYGANAGSGAFTHWSGWQPTRTLDRRGNATDTTYDAIYRPTRVIQRLSAATASTSAPLANEPAVETKYNRVHKVVQTTTWNETYSGSAGNASQRSYTFYDMLYRPTVAVTDLDATDGLVTVTGTTTVAGITGGARFMNLATQDATFTSFATDATALVSCIKYNVADKPTYVFVKDPLGNNVTRTVYDGAGRPTQVIQPSVAIVDPAGRNTSPATPTTITTYDPNGNAIQIENANHTRTQVTYDDRNRVTQTIVDLNGNGTFDPTLGVAATDIVSLTRYNLEDKPVKVTDGRGYETDTTYDRAYRVTQVQQPSVADAENGGAMTRPAILTTYDPNGNVIQMTDPRGVITQSTYDTLNRAITSTQAVGTAVAVTTETRYDRNGNVTALILYNSAESGGAQLTSYVYDALNRKTSETLPSPDNATRVTTFTYYRNGAVKDVTDPKGQVRRSASYDLAGRLLTQELRLANSTVEETRTLTYDSVGRISTVADAMGSSTLTYDLLSRLLSEARSTSGQTAYTTQNGYDAAGNATQVIYPGATPRTISRTIDRAGRLTSQADSAGTPTTYLYDANSNVTKRTDANGVVTDQIFDALNRMTSTITTKSGVTISAYTYTFDRVGNRKVVVETLPATLPSPLPQRTTTYTYDAQYRLTGESWSGFSNAYVYDLAGNRTQVTNVNGATTTITTSKHDSLNRLISSVTGATTTTYQYDRNGNQTAELVGGVPTTNMTWDVANRLRSVTNGGTTVASTYDYRTRRQTKTVGGTATFFRYHGGVSFQELQAGVVQVEFVRGHDMGGGIGSILYSDRGGVRETFAYNPSVGHVAALTNASGVATETNRFDAFGRLVATAGSSPNNRLANTKERDVIGSLNLDAHGFRYYNPVTGRYISRDPIGYGDGMNVYAYVKNNPINRIDPLGLDDETPEEAKARRDSPEAAKAFHAYIGALSKEKGRGYRFTEADFEAARAAGTKAFEDGKQRANNSYTSGGAGLAEVFQDLNPEASDQDKEKVAEREEAGKRAAEKIGEMGEHVAKELSMAVLPFGVVGKTAIWTANKGKTVAKNAFGHFQKHGADFGAKNATEYVEKAHAFLHNPPQGVLTKNRPNGDVVRYDPGTNTFGVMDKSGAPRTFYKPDPAQHGHPSNLDYFNAQ